MSRRAVHASRRLYRFAFWAEVLRTGRKTPRYELRALEEGYRVAYYEQQAYYEQAGRR